jgi:hypothetical protein
MEIDQVPDFPLRFGGVGLRVWTDRYFPLARAADSRVGYYGGDYDPFAMRSIGG